MAKDNFNKSKETTPTTNTALKVPPYKGTTLEDHYMIANVIKKGAEVETYTKKLSKKKE